MNYVRASLVYEYLDTPVHRLDIRVKLVYTISLIVALFLGHTMTTIYLAAVTTTLTLVGKVWRKVLTVLIAVMPIISAFITIYLTSLTLLHGVEANKALITVGTIAFKFMIAISTIVLLLCTTKPVHMRYLLYKLGLPPSIVESVILTLRFVPTAIEDVQHVKEAMNLRGYTLKGTSLAQKISYLRNMLTPLIVWYIERAHNVAEVLELRHFSSRVKSFRDIPKLRYCDALFLLLTLAPLIPLVFIEFRLHIP